MAEEWAFGFHSPDDHSSADSENIGAMGRVEGATFSTMAARWGTAANGTEKIVGTLALILTFSPRRRNGRSPFLVLLKTVRQIQSDDISRQRRRILLLLGEKAGMRECVSI